MLQRKLYYAHIMLNYVMAFYLWPKGWAKPLVVNWQIMAACSYKFFNKRKFATMYHAVLDNYNYLGFLKGANEVNRQYFQQAVLLCLLKALYYARICSYTACIICPKLCWHNSPRPRRKYKYARWTIVCIQNKTIRKGREYNAVHVEPLFRFIALYVSDIGELQNTLTSR